VLLFKEDEKGETELAFMGSGLGRIPTSPRGTRLLKNMIK